MAEKFFKLNIFGDERLLKKFDDIEGYLDDLRKPLNDTGDLLMDKYDDNFPAEGRILRKPWKQLKASTLAQKARLGFGNKGILERTGKLRKGFEKKVTSGSVRVFNEVPYYKHHQKGSGRLPQRKMIDITENIKQDIIEIFRKRLSKVLIR
jgi:phage gpG-like protein